ncbi:caspase domain-containing protein [Amylostereum chailletii]|nr:caspase domain-containing protein [Amylostereum chailletii]
MYTPLPDLPYEEIAEWERRRQRDLSKVKRGFPAHELDQERLHRVRDGKGNDTEQGVPRRRAPRRRALLVGICYGQSSDSNEFSKLKGPHRDVNKFRKMLTTVHNYRKEDIIVMKDLKKVQDRLVPTRENLVREIQALVRGAESGDRFVFVFAGHSDQQVQVLADNVQPEDDGRDEFIIASDGEKIIDNDLYRWLVAPLPTGSGLTAIIDSCHSGTMLDLPHRLCNRVYVPRISRGRRRTKTMHNCVARRGALHPDFLPVYNSAENQLPTPKHQDSVSKMPLYLDTTDLPQSTVSASMRSPLSAIQGSFLKGAAFTLSPASDTRDPALFCSGYCSHGGQFQESKPDVISLSACNDMQNAWEDARGRSMIWFLCEYLTDHRSRHHEEPSYYDLMMYINYKLHGVAIILHKWTREAKKKGSGIADAPPVYGEMVNFQAPQLSSLVKLNMEEKIHF